MGVGETGGPGLGGARGVKLRVTGGARPAPSIRASSRAISSDSWREREREAGREGERSRE